jgi:hypothetical protein
MSCVHALAALATALSLGAQTGPQTGARGLAKPVIGKATRCCNPLRLQASSRGGFNENDAPWTGVSNGKRAGGES